jgi:hypothetical protein
MHTSTLSHLNTEHSLLKALYVRARHQHRTQPFVARICQVLRLVALLHDALRSDSPRRITTLLGKVSSSDRARLSNSSEAQSRLLLMSR